jgi:hypothetical protein
MRREQHHLTDGQQEVDVVGSDIVLRQVDDGA